MHGQHRYGRSGPLVNLGDLMVGLRGWGEIRTTDLIRENSRNLAILGRYNGHMKTLVSY